MGSHGHDPGRAGHDPELAGHDHRNAQQRALAAADDREERPEGFFAGASGHGGDSGTGRTEAPFQRADRMDALRSSRPIPRRHTGSGLKRFFRYDAFLDRRPDHRRRDPRPTARTRPPHRPQGGGAATASTPLQHSKGTLHDRRLTAISILKTAQPTPPRFAAHDPGPAGHDHRNTQYSMCTGPWSAGERPLLVGRAITSGG